MAKFNCAWLIHKQQFRSLTGIEPYTFLELVARVRPHWRERIELRRTVPGVRGARAELRITFLVF